MKLTIGQWFEKNILGLPMCRVKLNHQEQIDWMYDRLCEYDDGNKLRDLTFLDDIQKDREYVEKHFSISVSRRQPNFKVRR